MSLEIIPIVRFAGHSAIAGNHSGDVALVLWDSVLSRQSSPRKELTAGTFRFCLTLRAIPLSALFNCLI
jgi:hypothetical protein